jgi:hypothetical protein
MALSEGSIKPLTLEGTVGEKGIHWELFSTLEVFIKLFATDCIAHLFLKP